MPKKLIKILITIAIITLTTFMFKINVQAECQYVSPLTYLTSDSKVGEIDMTIRYDWGVWPAVQHLSPKTKLSSFTLNTMINPANNSTVFIAGMYVNPAIGDSTTDAWVLGALSVPDTNHFAFSAVSQYIPTNFSSCPEYVKLGLKSNGGYEVVESTKSEYDSYIKNNKQFSGYTNGNRYANVTFDFNVEVSRTQFLYLSDKNYDFFNYIQNTGGIKMHLMQKIIRVKK